MTQPNGAKAWNYNQQLASWDFTTQALIDVNNTGSTSYTWFPRVALGSGWGVPNVVTPASAFTTVTNGTNVAISNANNASMFTLSDQGLSTNPNNYYSVEFSAGSGFFIEFNAAIDTSLESTEHSSLWMTPREVMTGQRSGLWVEDDVLEILNGGGGGMLHNLHQWNIATLQASINDTPQNFGNLSDTNLHTYGRVVVPMALNGGFGKREIWLDGTHKYANDIVYSLNGTCAQSDHSSTIGLYSVADKDHYIATVGGPVTLKSIVVWGPTRRVTDPVVLDPGLCGADILISNGGRTAAQVTNTQGGNFEIACVSSPRSTGKYYYEISIDSYTTNRGNCLYGFMQNNMSPNNYPGATGDAGWVRGDMTVNPGKGLGVNITYSSTGVPTGYTVGTVLGFAIDFNAGKAWVAGNNTWVGSPSAGTGPTWTFTVGSVLYPMVSYDFLGGGIPQSTFNLTAQQQVYAPPSGFSAFQAPSSGGGFPLTFRRRRR
jgi:hypothetical protein